MSARFGNHCRYITQLMLTVGIHLQSMAVALSLSQLQTGDDRCALPLVFFQPQQANPGQFGGQPL
jgi:hypothetical protein